MDRLMGNISSWLKMECMTVLVVQMWMKKRMMKTMSLNSHIVVQNFEYTEVAPLGHLEHNVVVCSEYMPSIQSGSAEASTGIARWHVH